MIHFSIKEILELVKGWLAISLAFAILYSNPLENGFSSSILIMLAISLLTAGLGFLIHELSHKLIAEKYGCQTMFVADNKMLLASIAMSFFGFIFAAPGGVYIKGRLSQAQNGKISIAGPFSNFVLAIAFLPGFFLLPKILSLIAFYGFSINAWIGLFNMVPIANFDGSKIIKWNKFAYFSLCIALLCLVIISFIL